MKPLVIYHADCADGFGAAFAAWLKFGDEAEYIPMQYGHVKTPEDFDMKVSLACRNNEVYILDFSFPKAVMDAIFANAKRVVWLGHHKTAFETYCPGEISFYAEDELNKDSVRQIILDNNRSGALIAWEYFHPDQEVPMLIKHIDDYDRWQFKIKGTKEFNKALWSITPWTFKQWEILYNQMLRANLDWKVIYAEGAAILRAHDANVQAVVEGAARRVFIPCELSSTEFLDSTVNGLAANCPPHLASDVGHQLANKSGTYGLLWYINKEGKCLCSLRSNGDYDVSAIARTFGGGGHKNAAEFKVPIEQLLEWIK